MPELMPAERPAGGSPASQRPWRDAPQSTLSRPFGEFEELLDRLVSRSRVRSGHPEPAGGWAPVTGLVETPDGWVVEVEFPPGVDGGQVETRLAGRVLTVRVPRPASSPGGQKLN
jgi:HSP20 family molecular chaperone IbpA